MVNQKGLAVVAYLFGIVGGIIVYLITEKKDKFVRFHAKQSVLFNIAAMVVSMVIGGIAFGAAMVTPYAWLAMSVVWGIYSLALLVIWIALMIKAWEGDKYELPIIGEWAK